MALVNVADLSNEQRWGLLYLMQNENTAIENYNSTVEQRNANRIVSQPELTMRDLYTLQSFADYKLGQLCDQAYSQLIQFKEQEALRLFRSKTPEEQAAIVASLQIPDVVHE